MKKIITTIFFVVVFALLITAIAMKIDDFEKFESKYLGGTVEQTPTLVQNEANPNTGIARINDSTLAIVEDGEITATLTFSDEPDTIEWTDKYGLKHKEVWLDK